MENVENNSYIMANPKNPVRKRKLDSEQYWFVPQLLSKPTNRFTCGLCVNRIGLFYSGVNYKYYVFFCEKCINYILHNDEILKQVELLTYPYLLYSDKYGSPNEVTIIEKYELTKMCNDIRKSQEAVYALFLRSSNGKQNRKLHR